MPRLTRAIVGAALIGLFGVGAAPAHVTNISRSQVAVEGDGVDYRLSLSPPDIAFVVGADIDSSGSVLRRELEERRDAIAAYVSARLRLAAQGRRCALQATDIDFDRIPEQVDVRIAYRCPEPVERLGIDYRLFFDIDSHHRAFGRIDLGAAEEEFLLEQGIATIEFTVAPTRSAAAGDVDRFRRVLALGIEHILVGYDHILFLVALVIGQARLLNLVKIVTAFTLAHSLTLSLAWFGVIVLPSRLVESLIAVTIGYVAVENLLGKGLSRRWLLTFGLGLIHGLGFYGVLSDIELTRESVVLTLLAFNLGIEIGQLTIMAVLFAILLWWSRQPWYAPTARAVCAAILILAGYWTIERAFLA